MRLASCKNCGLLGTVEDFDPEESMAVFDENNKIIEWKKVLEKRCPRCLGYEILIVDIFMTIANANEKEV